MNKLFVGILSVVGVLVLGWGLIFLARGEEYALAVIDPSFGSDDAPILIEEYSDFECPACAAAAPILKGALKEYPTQVKFVYNDYPINSIHAQAQPAAQAALCAAQQGKFFEFHDGIFGKQSEWTQTSSGSDVEPVLVALANENELNIEEWNTCRNSRTVRNVILDDFKEGVDRGVNATPSFFVNGERVNNPGSIFSWIKEINKALEAKGITPENAIKQADTSAEEIPTEKIVE